MPRGAYTTPLRPKRKVFKNRSGTEHVKTQSYSYHIFSFFVNFQLSNFILQNHSKVKAPIAGQSHEFFLKLEIYESLIAILVYRIQTSKHRFLKSEKFVELEIKTSPRKKNFSTEAQGWSKCSKICSIN